jgi:cytochrome oxidase Cu insertion factor (SCO1/SenC/PrrC family)
VRAEYPQGVIALRWALGGLVLVLAAVVGALLLVGRPHSTPAANASPVSDTPAATWGAGKRAAPAFRLADESGRPISLAAFRGRQVILTFIDPLCRNYCPIEAQHLDDVVGSFPAAQQPAVVAVSVNTAGNTRATLLEDRQKWSLGPEWHWAIGSGRALARVWRAYGIAVLVSTRRIAGIKVRNVVHTEAAYVVDPRGYERAIFVWPYSAQGMISTLRSLSPQS